MASRKLDNNNTARAKNKMATKSSIGKPVKRPARGYHKFRNGLLNVTPKGSEKQLTRSNRSSPLLRLPAEIRNRIWEFVLGGKVYRAKCMFRPFRAKLSISLMEPPNAMAILRTCRQIYAEAALMPLSLNTFSFDCYDTARMLIKRLKMYKSKRITSLRFDLRGRRDIDYPGHFNPFPPHRLQPLFQLLPALKELRVRAFNVPTAETLDFDGYASPLRKELEEAFPGHTIDLIFERRADLYDVYNKNWMYSDDEDDD